VVPLHIMMRDNKKVKINKDSKQTTITNQEQQFYLQNRIKGRENWLKKNHQEIENKILEIVRLYSLRDGISHQDLAGLVPIHRTNLKHYTDQLMKENKIFRKNKKGKYFAIDHDIIKDPILNCSIFSDAVRFNLLQKTDKFLILNDDISQIFSNYQSKAHIHNFSSYKELYQPKFKKNENLEKMLFEFSNRIGSFITYLIIYSINFISEYLESTNLTNKEKDAIIKRMVEEGITKLIPYLPYFLIDTVNKALGNYPRFNFELSKEYLKKNPKLVLDNPKDINYKLTNAFTKLYPLMSYEFERMLPQQFRLIYGETLKGRPSAIEKQKEYLNEYYESLRKQKSFKQEYKKKSKTSY
jgi:hypothetical protein